MISEASSGILAGMPLNVALSTLLLKFISDFATAVDAVPILEHVQSEK